MTQIQTSTGKFHHSTSASSNSGSSVFSIISILCFGTLFASCYHLNSSQETSDRAVHTYYDYLGMGKRITENLVNKILATIVGYTRAERSSSSSTAPSVTAAAPTAHKEEGGIIILEGEEEEKSATSRAIKVSIDGKGEESPIRMIIQRCRHACLLLEPETEKRQKITAGFGQWKEGGDGPSSEVGGIVVYLSFAKGATESMIYNAATTLLNLPLLTHGKWGDGTKTLSALQMATELDKSQVNIKSSGEHKNGVSIMIIPQASLISKIKNSGKSVQYHNQINKQQGVVLYEKFVHTLHLVALQHQLVSRKISIPASLQKELDDLLPASLTKKNTELDASVAPEKMFHDSALYTSWDDSGFPLRDEHGEAITKSAVKKLKKMYQAQKKRYSKYIMGGGPTASAVLDTVGDINNTKEGDGVMVRPVHLDDHFINLIVGTFGNRQALEFSSDMGPFCHVLNLG